MPVSGLVGPGQYLCVSDGHSTGSASPQPVVAAEAPATRSDSRKRNLGKNWGLLWLSSMINLYLRLTSWCRLVERATVTFHSLGFRHFICPSDDNTSFLYLHTKLHILLKRPPMPFIKRPLGECLICVSVKRCTATVKNLCIRYQIFIDMHQTCTRMSDPEWRLLSDIR